MADSARALETRGAALQAVCITFVVLAFVATILRVYVRTCIVKAFGWDDGWMILALLFHIMFAGCAIGGIHWGTGRHMDTLTNKEIFMAMRYWWLCYIAYCWAMICSKISIGLFLLRVTVKSIHKWIIYGVMTLTVVTGLVFFLVTLLQCTPIDFFWNKNQDGWCVNIDVIIGLTFLYSVCSVICDFTFAILPIFLVWNLNMSARTRLALIPILGMACVASLAVVVRMAYVMDFKNPDFLWATVDIAIWSDTEQGLAIAAGSLATLRPLFRMLGSCFGFTSTENTPSNSKPPTGMRTPQWRGAPKSNDTRKKPLFSSFTSSLFRTEKGGTKLDHDDEYGLGDLQPIRLRDDLVNESISEKDDTHFNTWTIQTGKLSDEDHRAGTITRQKEIFQQSDRV
ncbi:hypothetical protein ACN47E_009355 [Coniothyrium glycines]